MEAFLIDSLVLVMPFMGISALLLLRLVYKKALSKPR